MGSNHSEAISPSKIASGAIADPLFGCQCELSLKFNPQVVIANERQGNLNWGISPTVREGSKNKNREPSLTVGLMHQISATQFQDITRE